MTFTYRLFKDVAGRTAAQLNWNLKQFNSPIRIIINNTIINAKSLVAILNARMRFNDVITVIIDEIDSIEDIKEYFNEIGREI